MAEPLAQHVNTWLDIPLAFLDWPFLLFVVVLLFGYHFRDKIVSLLERGDIQISWGKDKHIKLKDLSDGIDQELDPIRDEILELRKQLRTLAEKHPELAPAPLAEDKDTLDDAKRKDAENKIVEGLKNPNFRWRTLEKLAASADVDPMQAASIIQANPDIIQKTGKQGNLLARLKDR